jgi:hypothetical protein
MLEVGWPAPADVTARTESTRSCWPNSRTSSRPASPACTSERSLLIGQCRSQRAGPPLPSLAPNPPGAASSSTDAKATSSRKTKQYVLTDQVYDRSKQTADIRNEDAVTDPGWYPNPDGTPTTRYWDGTQWTAHTVIPPPGPYQQGPMVAGFPVAYPAPTNGIATASLVLGLLGAVIEWGGLLTLAAGVLAVIFGAVGIGRAGRTNQGHGRAVAGLILGCIAIVAYIFWGAVTVGVLWLI